MIKYLGSKRLLVGVLGDIADAVGAATALDLFTGTTRVAQELKRRGMHVTTVDVASYSAVLSDCYIATDARSIDLDEVDAALAELAAVPGVRGYVTKTFCEQARFFQPHNGMRIDAIRDAIEHDHATSPLRPVLLTALLDAADRVDSTTGLQMAFLKKWSARSYDDLALRRPALLPGPGRTFLGDARHAVESVPRVDLAYLDPPYNQHRYFTNYHVWETLVRWDAPAHYGIACKRIDARDDATKSVFNRKRDMPSALRDLIGRVNAETVVVSYNDESWVTAEEMTSWLRAAGHEEVGVLAFDAKRYVGAQIGIFNGAGQKVGRVGRLRNQELVFVAGPAEKVTAALATHEAALPARA
ncbi:MAG TPA: DNA adenine methylase [Marmoricola sp.]